MGGPPSVRHSDTLPLHRSLHKVGWFVKANGRTRVLFERERAF